MILLPLFGFAAGLAIGRRWALAVTVVGGAIGFTLAALLTDEESGWLDAFIWVDAIVALLATLLGIQTCRWYCARQRSA